MEAACGLPAAGPSLAERFEALERATQEVEAYALEAIYGSDDADGFTMHSEAALLAARSAAEAGLDAAADGWAALQLDVERQVVLEEAAGAPRVRLRCTLPPGYPETSAAAVSV